MNLEAEAVRTELERLGIVVEGLDESQLVAISRRVLDKFDGVVPDVQELAIIVDDVRKKEEVRPSEPRDELSASGLHEAEGEAGTPVGGPQQDASTLGSGSPIGVQRAASPSSKPRYLATERTTRLRLAKRHEAEDKRTGLYIRPRRPDPLSAFAVHPACRAAFEEGVNACSRCTPLLHPATCECDTCSEWWAQVDG